MNFFLISFCLLSTFIVTSADGLAQSGEYDMKCFKNAEENKKIKVNIFDPILGYLIHISEDESLEKHGALPFCKTKYPPNELALCYRNDVSRESIRFYYSLEKNNKGLKRIELKTISKKRNKITVKWNLFELTKCN